MAEVLCDFCGNKFTKKNSQIELSAKNFCSKFCSQQATRKGKVFSCFVCGKKTYKSLKDIKASKSKHHFCSRICANTWIGVQQRTSNHPNWIHGGKSYKIMMKREGRLQNCFLCKEGDS